MTQLGLADRVDAQRRGAYVDNIRMGQ